MGLFDWMKPKKTANPLPEPNPKRFEMLNEEGDFYAWDGNIYKSDIVRACIRPKSKAIGKLSVKHVRESGDDFKLFPDVNLRYLLEEPNPLMGMSTLLEKMTNQLELNNNAFAQIKRDDFGNATEIYPLKFVSVEAIEGKSGTLFLKFSFRNGKTMTLPYGDVIHLRKDFHSNDIFGDDPHDVLTPLMEIVNTTDQGIVKAIKNGAAIKWLMKFKQVLRPEDMRQAVDDFNEEYLNVENNASGAAAADARYDLDQVKPNDYVPNAEQMDKTTQRIYNFYNTNEKIIQSKYNEDEWNSYYESEIEPIAIQLASEFTRKIFNRNQRGYGNKIVFESSSLQYASMQTKMKLVDLVDRGAMSVNEMRGYFNMAPAPHGNEFVRRLDTAAVTDKKAKEKALPPGNDDEPKDPELKGGDNGGQATKGDTAG